MNLCNLASILVISLYTVYSVMRMFGCLQEVFKATCASYALISTSVVFARVAFKEVARSLLLKKFARSFGFCLKFIRPDM